MFEKSLEQIVMEAIDQCIRTRCKRCGYGGDISARKENRRCQGRLIADHLRKNGVVVQRWIRPLEYYPKKNEIILIHDIYGNTYVGPSVNTPISRIGYWMPLPEPPKEGE